MKFWITCLILLSSSLGCATIPTKVDHWDDLGYAINNSFDEETNSLTVRGEYLVEAPPWRVLNLFLDFHNIDLLFGVLHLVSEPVEITREDGVKGGRGIVADKYAWFAPTMTAIVDGFPMRDGLGYESTCVGGDFQSCYQKVELFPVQGGKKTRVLLTVYAILPGWIPDRFTKKFGIRMAETIGRNIRSRVMAPEYADPDRRYPWAEIEQFSGNENLRSRQHKKDSLTLSIGSFTGSVSSPVLLDLASTYFADQLATATDLRVLRNSDQESWALFLKNNWVLLCDESDSCEQRLTRLARVQFLVTGTLFQKDSDFQVALTLQSAKTGQVVWRSQASSANGVVELKKILSTLARELGSSSGLSLEKDQPR